MAAINEVHVGDAGLAFQVQVLDQGSAPLDVSQATVTLLLQKPDGSLATFPLTPATGGTDGIVQYLTGPADFDQAGTWRYQVSVVVGPDLIYSNVAKFRVYPNLPLA